MIQLYKLLRSQCEDHRPISGPAGPATRIDNDERPGLDRFQSKSRCMASHTSDISHCSTARTCCSWSSPLIVALLICCAREGRQPGKGEAVSYFHCIITAVKQAPPPLFYCTLPPVLPTLLLPGWARPVAGMEPEAHKVARTQPALPCRYVCDCVKENEIPRGTGQTGTAAADAGRPTHQHMPTQKR